MMRKPLYLLLIAVLINITQVNAQANARQQAYEMLVNGVKVIVQPSGNDIVEIQTIIKGGVQNYPASKMGIESMAISALTECGTLQHDKNTIKNALEKISADVYGGSNKNFSEMRLNCIKSDFNTAWALYAEILTTPQFNPKEFERTKQDAINDLKQQEANPDGAIDRYADKVAFAGLDYAKDPYGTPAIIQKLTPAETKKYYHSILTRSRMLMVIVGDLDRETIRRKIAALLINVKQGEPFKLKKTNFSTPSNTFSSENRELSTNYVEGISGGPAPGTPDFNAFNVAMRLFTDKHFLEVRTNNGLSYAPLAWFSSGTTAVARFAVSTKEPDKYIKVFNKLVAKVKKEGFSPDEVKDIKITYLTSFYYKNETNSAQASSLVLNEVLHNNWRRSLTMVNDINKLTTQQISDAFRKYIGNIVWVYQGDVKKVNPLLYTGGVGYTVDH